MNVIICPTNNNTNIGLVYVLCRDFRLPHSRPSPPSTYYPTALAGKGRWRVSIWRLWREIWGLYKFPPIVCSASSDGTWPVRLPCWWADLKRGLSSILLPVGDTDILDRLTEQKYILLPSCLWVSCVDCPGCPDSESEHPGLVDSSDSESYILVVQLNLTSN